MRNVPVIVAIDDDSRVLRLISMELSRQGFRVEVFEAGGDALEKLSSIRPDLVVLDLLMPEMDGYEVLKNIRTGSNVPVLMLTAKGADPDKIRALEMGADDYLPKPFNPAELTARVRAILRREDASRGMPTAIRVGDLEIDLSNRVVLKQGSPVGLTRTEWLMMVQLASNPGKVMMHEELLSEIWGTEFINDVQYLRIWVSHLRRKLGENGKGASLIKTVTGMGYVFDPEHLHFSEDNDEAVQPLR